MDNRGYYYAKKKLFFLTEEEARNYFYEKQVFYEMEDEFSFGCALSERYTIIDVFRMTDKQKNCILDEFRERPFEDWIEGELSPCDMYK